MTMLNATPATRRRSSSVDGWVRSWRRLLLALLLIAGVWVSWGQAAEETGLQVDGSISHIAFQALGRDNSITPLEVFPYVMADNQILFGDFRAFVANDGQLGGNFGTGWRFIEPNEMALFGISGWYDFDQSTGESYHQLGLSLEARMEWVGLGTNLYLPVGDKNQLLGRNISNVHFEDHQLLFDVRGTSGEAMPGADVTLSAYLPFDYLIDHQVQAHVGWYHFQGDTQDDIDGYKVQLDGNIVPSVSAQVAFTQDDTFGSNTTVGLSWRFGTSELPETDLEGQLRRFAQRNYNVIVGRSGQSLTNVAAVNAATDEAYVIQHIGSGIGTDSGSMDDPWRSVSQAQLAGGDVLYVHGNTTLSESIILQDGQSLLGEGTPQQLVDATYGAIRLPSTTGATNRAANGPRIANSLGTAITMANNSVVSGFVIENAGGNGIVASGVDNARIIDISVRGAQGSGLVLDGATNTTIEGDIEIENVTGDGIRLSDINDTLEFGDIHVTGAGGAGIRIDGGHGEITLGGETVIENTLNAGLVIQNIQTLAADPEDEDDEDTIGTVIVDDLTIRSSPHSRGIVVTDSDGLVNLKAVDVETTNGAALYLRDASDVWIADGTLSATGAPVADIEGSAVNIALTSVFANGGAVGLRIVDTEGSFFVYGDGATDDEDAIAGTGGVIQNTDVAVELNGAGSIGLSYVNFRGNSKVATATDSDSLQITFAKITETSDAFVEATNLTNFSLTRSYFEDNALSSGHGIQLHSNTSGSFVSTFTDNVVVDTNGDLLTIATSAGGEAARLNSTFNSNNITLTGTGDRAVRLNWGGVVQAEFSSNIVTGDAGSQTALDLQFGSSSNTTEVAVHANAFVLNGANSAALRLNSGVPTSLSVQQNQVAFYGRDSVGFDMTLGKTSTVNVSSNAIYDHAGGATGIRFPSVYDGTRIILNNNTIDLSEVSLFVDQGIVLSNVAGDDNPFVTIESTTSNTISGASTPYSFPGTGVTGQLIINNSVIQ